MTKTQKIITVSIVFVLTGGWFFWFRHYLDRQKFKQIENFVMVISHGIQQDFGMKEVEFKRYCSRSTQKFKDGPLSCVVSSALYDNRAGDIFSYVVDKEDFIEHVIWKEGQSGAFSLKTPEGVVCGLDTDEEPELVELKCSEFATRPHFELLNE